MKIRRCIAILLTIVVATNLFNKTESPTYYGNNGQGQLAVLNDSI